uniref:1-alkyl-2-acetylglycerophosphocholine esterase n=1 Tax=Angiostrongylus cantonensis TaxID=6313 RepID=A0A0K0CT97_ANGCA
MGALWSVTSRASILPLVGSGPYAAGCADLMITDSNDGDTGVFLRIYYPTDKDRVNNRTRESDHPLWIDRPEYVTGLASYLKHSAGRLQYILNWIIGETRMACIGRAKLARHLRSSGQQVKDAFPVIVFCHGLAGSRHFYSTFCSSLASYGFVVAAIEHSDYSACWTYKLVPDTTSGRLIERHFPVRLLDHTDKRTLKIRTQQLSKRVSEAVKALHVLEEINLGQLQSDKVAVGKDFDWTSWKAAVVLDGWLSPLDPGHYERASQPSLFLNAANWNYIENVGRIQKLRNITEKSLYTFK